MLATALPTQLAETDVVGQNVNDVGLLFELTSFVQCDLNPGWLMIIKVPSSYWGTLVWKPPFDSI